MKTKCHCGRLAARYPNLFTRLFRPAQAQTQRQAAQAHKCVPCYKVVIYMATIYLTHKERKIKNV